MQKKEYSIDVGGRALKATFSDLADQAHGSVLVSYDDTALLATAVMSKGKKDGDFFPLTVDFEERFYAGGKIGGSRFVRREGRPSDEAILSGRIVDRTIRPLFDQRMRNEVQIVITAISLGKGDPNSIGVIAASLALGVSQIPWNGPVSSVKIGIRKGEKGLAVNPSWDEDGEAELELLACGKDGLINMIEVASREAKEETLSKALKAASKEIEAIQSFQEKIIAERGKEKAPVDIVETPAELVSLFDANIAPRLAEAVMGKRGKGALEELGRTWEALVKERLPGKERLAPGYLDSRISDLVHDEAIDGKRRSDGRAMDEIRPLYAQAGGVSNMLHGSGIFYRGGTHVLSALTLGGPQDTQLIDGMEGEEQKRYMHHYNFPPFSTGETGRVGSTNRRMIGHGALAEKALLPVIPPKEDFPYTIRIVSEALASNGSTSMASVCGSTLALLDAGVPIKAPVAGMAMGLMMREGKKLFGGKKLEYEILTDIQGPEDHHGDMDFKVAGSRSGVTAVQMDVKVAGVPIDILEEALEKARAARLKVLDVIEKEISKPREKLSSHAPEILVIRIKPDQIGLVIGSGGKTINEIKAATKAEIDIEDDGTVFITGKNGSSDKARAIIEDMTREYKPGDRLDGEVTRVLDFGAFVRISKTAEGLVHVSELAPWRVEKASDLVKPGMMVPVVVKEIDEKGRVNLSIRSADPIFFKKPETR
ncbi:MAG: polyribonucleotide nucleotidyltransferase [Candidatus Taylorbacteria bacterium]|nr:polyribonucleotide nucleotidyltransferase [Candidatus Taylorbacteria bacterium]